MKNPMDFFFSLGDVIAKGDIKRKLDFDFYLLLIMFLAFASILFGNLFDFYKYQKLQNLGWGFVMLAILYFQYFGLKSVYDTRKMLNVPVQVENENVMLDEFNQMKEGEIEMHNKKCDICGELTNEDRDVCKSCIDKILKENENIK
jgi:hypothetical protein